MRKARRTVRRQAGGSLLGTLKKVGKTLNKVAKKTGILGAVIPGKAGEFVRKQGYGRGRMQRGGKRVSRRTGMRPGLSRNIMF